MVVKTKITEDELARLKEIQGKYYEVLIEIGKFEYEKKSLNLRLEHIRREIDLCFSDLETMTKQEQELKEKLQKKYGLVSIDTITGEISEIQK